MKKIYLLSILSMFALNLFCQTMWTKYPGNPVMSPGAAGEWDQDFVGLGSIIYLNETYYMWYTGGRYEDTMLIGMATSPDGITWTKYANNPVLEEGPAGSWDESSVYDADVIVIDDTFHMWYTGHKGKLNNFDFQIGHATSLDGITWTKDPNNPVLPRGINGTWDYSWVASPCVLYDSTIYHMWYVAWDGNWPPVWPLGCVRIGHATSPDGWTWTKDPLNPVLVTGKLGSWDYPRVDNPTVLLDDTTYHMWYSGGDFGVSKIGYAKSNDGSKWTKSQFNPVMGTGMLVSWEAQSVAVFSVIDSSGVKYKMWYTGSNNSDVTGSIGYAEAINDVLLPPQPTNISGNDTVCAGATEAYSVKNDPGVIYSWKVTKGGVSGNDTSNSINITWNSTGNERITVTPSNTYGSGRSRVLQVKVNSIPSKPDTITGEIYAGINDTCNYIVHQVTGTVSYNWEVSAGGEIIENYGDTISVLWNSSGNQTISVSVSNSCGECEPYILPVITDVFNLHSKNGISVYPNPASDIINIEISNAADQKMVIELLTVSGQVIYRNEYQTGKVPSVQQIDLSGYAKGVYFVRIRQAGEVYNGKIIVM